MLPVISREFGVGPARAGLTVSAVVLAVAAASSFYGPLADALGRRRVMAGATALLALATLACAFAPSFSVLLVLRAMQGVLVPGVTAVSVAYAGDRFRNADLPAVVGGIIAASVVGGLAGRVLSGAITANAGWRAAFVAFAIVTLAAALALARGLAPATGAPVIGWASATRGMLGHLRDPRLLGAYLVGASLFFGWIGIFTYLPYHLAGAPWHLTTGQISAVYLVYAAGVVASPIAGRLAGRIPPRRLIGIGLVVEALGMLAALAGSLPLAIAGLLVLVLGTFTAQAVAPGFVNVTARTAKGGASALYLTFYYVGGTLGSAVPGLALHAAGWPGVVATCVAGVGVGFVANWLLCGRPPRGRAPV
ncbi:major facilitator superfamily MFS_1 [Anaeromyxobacter sp. K]|uniref:MFS transporter n=1 Tax=Anaeromyxobacter sp. (strain K) TaxID=447217 RepID=UPI00015F8DF8|nr:MFS transporter [Anaeromyxobacter sp. K]ACG75336.1 major facilitator superfamily MFS_1 [Anaeromyxobacter sp. K]